MQLMFLNARSSGQIGRAGDRGAVFGMAGTFSLADWVSRVACLLFLGVVLAPEARAAQKILGQYADNYADVPSYVSPQVSQDLESADDFDVEGPIDRVVITGRLCFGCSAPDIAGVWLRFWAWDNGEVGALQEEFYLADGDPHLLYDPIDTTTLDLHLPTPFIASGKHFLSVQLETSSFSSWYWMSSGNGNHENSTLRHRIGSQGFGPYNQVFGVVDRDLSFELWGQWR